MTFLDFMRQSGYKPYNFNKKTLDLTKWQHWPENVLWKHNLSAFSIDKENVAVPHRQNSTKTSTLTAKPNL